MSAIFVGYGLDLRRTWDNESNDSRLLHLDEIDMCEKLSPKVNMEKVREGGPRILGDVGEARTRT